MSTNQIQGTENKRARWSAKSLRHDVSGNHFWLFKVPTADGSIVDMPLSNELTTSQLVRAIRAKTTLLPSSTRAAQALVDTMKVQAGDPQPCTDRPGWKFIDPASPLSGPLAFVTPHQVFDFGDSSYRWLSGTDRRTAEIGACRGTTEGWRASCERFASQSNYIAFSIMCALAAALRPWTSLAEDPVFNFYGDSSTGKTTAIRVGAALQGHPNAICTWDQTARGLEETAARHTHSLLLLNAAERCQPRQKHLLLTRIVHMLSEGASTVRSAGVQERFPDLTWQCVSLSTSNASGREMATSVGAVWGPQDDARFIDIPVPSVAQGGIFDRLEPSTIELGAQITKLIHELDETLIAEHGTLLGSWVKHIQTEMPADRIECYINRFLRKQGLPIGLEGRIARKFGLIYAAGKIANEHAQILGWNACLPLQAVSTLYERSTARRLGEPTCPAGLATFAKLIADPRLVQCPTPGHAVSARRERDLLAVRCRQGEREVIGLRLASLREHLPTEHQLVESWLAWSGAARKGHGGRRTCQVSVRITIGTRTNAKPRLLLLRPRRLQRALRKAGVT